MKNDPTARNLEYFETRVLKALEPAPPDPRAWAAAFRRLTDRLTTQKKEAEASGLVEDFGTAAATGLIHAARTFSVMNTITAGLELPPGPVCDLGAGWGPAALSLAIGDRRPTVLQDVSRSRLELGQRLMSLYELPTAEIRVQEGTRVDGMFAAITATYVLNELPTGAERRLAASSLEHLQEGGLLALVEPGTPEGFRRLRAVRDTYPELVQRPCTDSGPCPMNGGNWCHSRWKTPFGPVARQIAAIAKVDISWSKASFLVLRKGGALPRPNTAILDKLATKHRSQINCCNHGELRRLVALSRHKDAVAAVNNTLVGRQVDIEWDAATQRGDGARVDDATISSVLPAS